MLGRLVILMFGGELVNIGATSCEPTAQNTSSLTRIEAPLAVKARE